MSMDGLSLLAVTHELQLLVGGKVDKIQQPERDALLLTIRAGGSNYKLLLCAHAENGRVQLTQAQYPNPLTPPAFCMLLRKRLVGGRIQSITQPGLDRVSRIEIQVQNELGDLVEYALVTELMGRHSNIIAVNEKGVVLDCARHVGIGMSNVRFVMPGVSYEPPPAQVKQDPRQAGEADFYAVLENNGRIHKLLSGAFFGLSPLIASLLCQRYIGEGEMDASALSLSERKTLARGLYTFYQQANAGQFSPTIVLDQFRDVSAVYAFRPAMSDTLLQEMPSMCLALDEYYAKRDVQERLRRNGASLHRIVQNNLERCYKKLGMFEEALSQQERLEEYRLYGELFMANLHALKRGMQAAKVVNFYSETQEPIVIPLDERFSPQENAQRYFKKYKKGKAAKTLAVQQRAETLEEIAYLEGQQDNLNKCSTDDELSEIREELEREGYAKKQTTGMKPQKHQPSKPLHYRSSEGIDIYVGKNNRQNDTLTLRFAADEDTWLHVKEIPGSHVIVQHKGPLPEQTLLEAAMLAAYYSKARTSASVPVDYCLRKYVKKPAKAKPGMVIYTTNRTLYVTPEEAMMKGLQVLD